MQNQIPVNTDTIVTTNSVPKPKKFYIIILIILGCILIFGATKFLVGKQDPVVTQPEVVLQSTIGNENMEKEIILHSYSSPELGITFKYPEDFTTLEGKEGEYEFKATLEETDGGISFTEYFYFLSVTMLGIGKDTRDEVATQDKLQENYTGDSDYRSMLTAQGWDKEKELLDSTSNEGFVDCISEVEGVRESFLCEIRTIGENRYLIRYQTDSYKGETSYKQYIIYKNDARYVITTNALVTENIATSKYDELSKTTILIPKSEFIESVKNGSLFRTEITRVIEDIILPTISWNI